MTVNNFIYKNESEEPVVVLGTRKPHGSNSEIYPKYFLCDFICVLQACLASFPKVPYPLCCELMLYIMALLV